MTSEHLLYSQSQSQRALEMKPGKLANQFHADFSLIRLLQSEYFLSYFSNPNDEESRLIGN